ncbi:hypothetical protein SteCoe_38532 [Stentor coeruleus]|uniref:Uncharacterized protein n=1 Tax=Stentor coeruleus TaxID=5963 RepID=A0A1R2AL97_9CILI|nr:hypothetical protein SteCoe_38532 [Stentor coeruleus]
MNYIFSNESLKFKGLSSKYSLREKLSALKPLKTLHLSLSPIKDNIRKTKIIKQSKALPITTLLEDNGLIFPLLPKGCNKSYSNSPENKLFENVIEYICSPEKNKLLSSQAQNFFQSEKISIKKPLPKIQHNHYRSVELKKSKIKCIQKSNEKEPKIITFIPTAKYSN